MHGRTNTLDANDSGRQTELRLRSTEVEIRLRTNKKLRDAKTQPSATQSDATVHWRHKDQAPNSMHLIRVPVPRGKCPLQAQTLAPAVPLVVVALLLMPAVSFPDNSARTLRNNHRGRSAVPVRKWHGYTDNS